MKRSKKLEINFMNFINKKAIMKEDCKKSQTDLREEI
jgi:hypothetical protein